MNQLIKLINFVQNYTDCSLVVEPLHSGVPLSICRVELSRRHEPCIVNFKINVFNFFKKISLRYVIYPVPSWTVTTALPSDPQSHHRFSPETAH